MLVHSCSPQRFHNSQQVGAKVSTTENGPHAVVCSGHGGLFRRKGRTFRARLRHGWALRALCCVRQASHPRIPLVWPSQESQSQRQEVDSWVSGAGGGGVTAQWGQSFIFGKRKKSWRGRWRLHNRAQVPEAADLHKRQLLCYLHLSLTTGIDPGNGRLGGQSQNVKAHPHLGALSRSGCRGLGSGRHTPAMAEQQPTEKQAPCDLAPCLGHSGCNKKMPQTGWFMNSRKLFLAVLELGDQDSRSP